MKNGALKKAVEYSKMHMRKKKWQTIVTCLAAIVVFFTTYALILPAITLEKEVAYCDHEEHQHGADCYEAQLLCEQEETGEHVHTDECYGEPELTCDHEEHRHTLACYSNSEADVEIAADWEAALPEKLTGIWAEDLIAVAESQLDYAESTDNYKVIENEKTKGYTRYGEWYGDPYVDWDAMFVSFCLNYAGIPVQAVPQDASARNWSEKLAGITEGYERYELYREAGDYVPAPGDLVFFDTDADGETDHVGITTEYSEATLLKKAQIKTIEGDIDDKVQAVTYELDDEKIVGYAVLPENPDLEIEEETQPSGFDLDTDDGIMPMDTDDDNSGSSVDSLDGQTFAIVNNNNSAAVAMQSTPFGEKNLAGTTVTLSKFTDVNVVLAENISDITTWTFDAVPSENTGSENQYYISTTVNGNSKYLSISPDTGLTLSDAQIPITVTSGTDSREGMYRLTGTSGYAVNLYGGSAAKGFGPWNGTNDRNEWQHLCKVASRSTEVTGKEVTEDLRNQITSNLNGGQTLEVHSYDVSYQIKDQDGYPMPLNGDVTVTVSLPSAVSKEEAQGLSVWKLFSVSEEGVVTPVNAAVVTNAAGDVTGFTITASFVNGQFSGTFVLAECGGTISVEKFDMWLFALDARITNYAKREKVAGYNENEKGSLTDVLQVPESDIYLIPVTYFESNYKDYGYSFDRENPGTCPFKYAPSATSSTSNLTNASYVKVDGAWYVRIRDEGLNRDGYDYPRSNIYYSYEVDYNVVTDTQAHPSSIINLFDYWTTGQGDIDYGMNKFKEGINANHALKFSSGRTSDKAGTDGNWNVWTGSASVYPGIVANKLGKDGYPQLSGKTDVFIPKPDNLDNVEDSVDLTESLAYLFDPTKSVAARAVHRNVTGLMQLDTAGYYYYNSQENYAEYEENSNSFKLYDTWGVLTGGSSPNGQFFPFNSMDEAYNLKSTNTKMNHYFGMTLTTTFIQQYDGYTSANRTADTTFEFAGDDDVWIFIDDVLVADLGGIHNKASVTINFRTGDVKINEGTNYSSSKTLKGLFDAAGADAKWNETNNPETFANNTYHTLKFYYLERGNTDSNLWLKYNLIDVPSSSIVKVDQYGKAVEGAKFALYAAKKGTAGADDTARSVYRYKIDGSDNDSDSDSGKWTMLEEIGANYQINEETGVISWKKAGQDYTITPIYYGETDGTGTITFIDKTYHTPLTLEELQKMAGSEQFILRELKVPDGYRQVTDEIWLFLTNNNNVLMCDDTYTSGAWASATLQVEAPGTLYLTDSILTKDSAKKTLGDAKVDYDENNQSIQYYTVDRDGKLTTKGTLFAVVLKYQGSGQGPGNVEDTNTDGSGDGENTDGGETDAVSPLTDIRNWVPVSGSDLSGYTLRNWDTTVDTSDLRSNFLYAAINAAVDADKYGDIAFKASSNSTTMLTMTNLPGDLGTYYYMLQDGYEGKSEDMQEYLEENTKYTIAYYWTTVAPDNWYGTDEKGNITINVAADNTFRVDAERKVSTGDAGDGNQKYEGFYRVFGANIAVPNLLNRVFAQKFDRDGNRVNGATFAMYKVSEETDRKIYYVDSNGRLIYLEPDADQENPIGDNRGKAWLKGGTEEGTYEINEVSGVITVKIGNDEYIINPAVNANNGGEPLVGTTEDSSLAGENGTCVFTNLNDGTYYMREISPPDGYVINATEVMVLVDDTSVYANAGTANDGVTVARGPGYVVSTLYQFASAGDIDRTLTWIYTMLKVSKDNTNTFHIGNYSEWKWAIDRNGTLTEGLTPEDKQSAMRTYLKFAGTNESALFNYVLNTEKGMDGTTVGTYSDTEKPGTSTRRLYTDVGWSYLEIYQDSNYREYAESRGYNYTNLHDFGSNNGDISSLFSRSVFVQMTDDYSSIVVKKVDSTDNSKVLAGAEFTLSRMVEEGNETKTYYYTDPDNSAGASNSICNGNIQGAWTDVPEKATKLVSDNSGTIYLKRLPDGEYILTEVAAPAGYNLLTEQITFTIKSGVVVACSRTYTSDSLTVINSPGVVLPNTGGRGTYLYTFSGLLLSAGALMCWYMLRRKRERRSMD